MLAKKNLKLPPKQEMPSKVWYYKNAAGVKLGPFSVIGLRGHIDAETPVWRQGMAIWPKAGDVEELKSVLTAKTFAAKIDPHAEDDLPKPSELWIWCLAVIPIPLTSLLPLIIGMDNYLSLQNAFHGWFAAVVAVVLNTFFALFDGHAISATGRDKSKVSVGWAIIIVPVYMFLRAARCSKKFAPAIVWCIIAAADTLAPLLLGASLLSLLSSAVAT